MNIALINNVTDEELIRICQFKKPEFRLDNNELLIIELVKRLESSKEHATGYDNLLDELKELKEELLSVGNKAKEIIEDNDI